MQYQHKTPNISEVNLEVKDFNFYFNEEILDDSLIHSIAVKASYQPPNTIVFFIHFRIKFKSHNGIETSLFHVDYLSAVEITEVDWTDEERIFVNTEFLAYILGKSIVMIRGAIAIRLASNILYNYPFPVVNPSNIILEEFEQDKKGNSVLKAKDFGFSHD